MTTLAELAEEYSQSRLGVLRLIAAKQAKEKLMDEETRAKLRLGGFPKWFSIYYDASESEDSLLFLQKILAAWRNTHFEPNDQQRQWLEEAEISARRMAQLRNERSQLTSMRNETSFVLVEMARHIGVTPELQIKRDADRLVKSRIKPVDYLDSMKDVATVDVIEKLYEESPDVRKKVQEISLDHLSVMERVCFRAHIEIPMSYGRIADELSTIARTVADEYGITDNVGLGKDSVATHVQNAHKKLRKHRYQRRVFTDEEIEPNSPFDEYEQEMRRRFQGGLYLSKEKAMQQEDTVQAVLF